MKGEVDEEEQGGWCRAGEQQQGKEKEHLKKVPLGGPGAACGAGPHPGLQGEQPTLKQGNLEQPVKMKMDLANGHPNGPSDASDLPRIIITTTTTTTIIIIIILSQYPPSVCRSRSPRAKASCYRQPRPSAGRGPRGLKRHATGSSVRLQVEVPAG